MIPIPLSIAVGLIGIGTPMAVFATSGPEGWKEIVGTGSALATVIGLGIVYQKMRDQIDGLSKRMDATEIDVKEVNKSGGTATEIQIELGKEMVADHERRIQKIEDAVVCINGLATDIAWIKNEIQRHDHSR